jgi:hypothetical protein
MSDLLREFESALVVSRVASRFALKEDQSQFKLEGKGENSAKKLDPDDIKRRLSAYTNVVVDTAIELDSHTKNPLEFYAKCSEILLALGDVFDHVDDEELAKILRDSSKEIISSGETYRNKNYWKKYPSPSRPNSSKAAHLAFKYQPKETKQHKAERVGESIREATGISKGIAHAIADAFVRGRDVSALSVQKNWPIEQGVITGPKGNMSVSELTL